MLSNMKHSAAVYGVTAWVAVAVIMYHVVMDWPVSTVATLCATWVVIALPLLFVLDGICALIRWVKNDRY